MCCLDMYLAFVMLSVHTQRLIGLHPSTSRSYTETVLFNFFFLPGYLSDRCFLETIFQTTQILLLLHKHCSMQSNSLGSYKSQAHVIFCDFSLGGRISMNL